jgi:hypothetical protein
MYLFRKLVSSLLRDYKSAFLNPIHKEWESVHRLATGWATEGQEFSLLHVVQTGCAPPPPAANPMGTGTRSPGVKRPGRETEHLSPNSAEVKKMWIYKSTPPYSFMA